MNDAVKNRIYTEERVHELLEALGCENIRYEGGGRCVAQLPPRFNSNNRRSVQVYIDERLTSYVRSRSIVGDIYTLVGYIQFDLIGFEEIRQNFGMIREWICETLGYHELLRHRQGDLDIVTDWNAWLRPIQKARPKQIEFVENEVLDESILDQYVNMAHLRWVREGLSVATQYEFGVKIDIDSERIVFPVHNKNGQLIGVKGRYFGDSPEIEDDYKYLPLYPYSKGMELFNLHRAMPHIQEQNQVIVVEAAKSCMFLTQWGYKNCVSLEGKNITSHQVKLLKELKVPIVFAWDKDVSVREIKRFVWPFKTRLIYVVFDTQNLLSGKDAPIDKGKNIWDTLYSMRYKISLERGYRIGGY